MTATDDLALLDERLCFALYSTAQAITKEYKALLGRLNMTYPQYLVFLALSPEDEMTVKALGERLYLDSGTLSPLLKRMQQAGYITRYRDPEDERKVMVGLTEQARALTPEIAAIQKHVSCSTGLEKTEFQQLLQQLHSLNHQLREGNNSLKK